MDFASPQRAVECLIVRLKKDNVEERLLKAAEALVTVPPSEGKWVDRLVFMKAFRIGLVAWGVSAPFTTLSSVCLRAESRDGGLSVGSRGLDRRAAGQRPLGLPVGGPSDGLPGARAVRGRRGA